MTPFHALFDRPAAAQASAPGRVNLMGDHTDYNAGLVLPAAIPQRTEVEIAGRTDRLVRLWSDQFAAEGIVEYELGSETPGRGWVDYVAGVTQQLAKVGLSAGFEARLTSAVPLGSGLSSSASLEIAMSRAIRAVHALDIDDVALARAAQRAEVEFVGAPVGLMDQMACSMADERAALFLDTLDLHYERVPLPDTVALVVIHSGLSHHNVGGGYAERRQQCDHAAARLGVGTLRELDVSDMARVEQLPDPLSRRVRHVITENARVLATVAALRAGDLAHAGRLFNASHASLRDDYNVSIPQVDRLVELASRGRGCYGARMTGGGFGGSIVALAEPDAANRLASETADSYQHATGVRARVILPV
ncbi:MAG: galactokinase [Vicinamibacterales bacterium]